MIGFKEIYDIIQVEGNLWASVLLGFIIVTILLMIVSIRYKIILHFLNERISLFDSFNISSSSHFISYISPFRVGFIITKPLITRAVSTISFKKSTLASVFEQFYEIAWQIMILPILIFIIGSKYFSENLVYQILFIIILLASALLLVINSEKVIHFTWRFRFIVPGFVRNLSKKQNISKERILQLIGKLKVYLKNWKMIFYVTLPTIAHFFLSPVILAIFLRAFGYPLHFYLILSSFWVSLIIGRLSGLPSGLGSREATLGAILISYGVSVADAIKIVLLARVVALMPTIIFGSMFLIWKGRKVKEFWKVLKRNLKT